MLKRYIILWLSFQLLVVINCQMVPKQRYGHTATLIDRKLYILGGVELNASAYVTEFTEMNFFILMFLYRLILIKYYRYGKIYQALISFRHTLVLLLLKAVQIIAHYFYLQEIHLNWFIHLIHKAIRGVFQQI
jgi:hypothetical protein